MNNTVGICVILIVSCACVTDRHQDSRTPKLSVAEILEEQEAYFEGEIAVAGFLSTGSENLHLYENSNAFKNAEYDRCLNVTFLRDTNYYDTRSKYHKKWVVATGTLGPIDGSFFDTGGCGYRGIMISKIEIRRIRSR